MSQIPTGLSVKALPLKPETQAHLAAQGVVQAIVFIVVGLRVYSRMSLGSGLGLDDLFVIAAVILSSALVGLVVACQVAGNGYHQADVMFNMPGILLLTFIIVPIYLSCLCASKMSMLAFYLRVFEKHVLRIWVYATMLLCVVWFIAHFLANVFICKPVRSQWQMALLLSGEGKCGEQVRLYQSMIISNMFTDLIIMTLPLKTIWGLQMRIMEKIGLMASFLLLGAVIVVGSVRVHYVSTVNMREDLTMTMPVSLLLTTLEPNFAILCVSIPTLRPLYRTYRDRYGSSRGATKLSDNATPTIGGSGAQRSGQLSSRKAGNDEIALCSYNFDGQNKSPNHHTDYAYTESIDSKNT